MYIRDLKRERGMKTNLLIWIYSRQEFGFRPRVGIPTHLLSYNGFAFNVITSIITLLLINLLLCHSIPALTSFTWRLNWLIGGFENSSSKSVGYSGHYSLKICIVRLIGDSKLPLSMTVRVNGVWVGVCPVMDHGCLSRPSLHLPWR